MVRWYLIVLGCMGLLLGCSGAVAPGAGPGDGSSPVSAAAAPGQTAPGEVTITEATGARAQLIVYRPRLASRPDVRVKPGDRGGTLAAYLTVLAPPHPGFTTELQPTLYWYVESPPGPELVVTLTTPGIATPLLERRLQPAAAGIQSLSLAEQGVRLAPGVDYEWHVALVLNPEHRSQDLLSTGAIQTLSDAGAPPADAPALARARWYAENGFWYDAYTVLQVAARRGDAVAREARAQLLAQVALTEVGERL